MAERIQEISVSYATVGNGSTKGTLSSSFTRQFLPQWKNVRYLFQGRLHTGTSHFILSRLQEAPLF